ncbi:MAG: UDP-N-acetylmuramoyl-tripeptide--D-alanyl-D-alanine ligase [Verrucomicrobia bacterium]|nr:UDP-N-acetylmuramoyl-tripeptide--D-alanyl-D-alanine ligase [Verrucomicrobiota bacterium]
MEAFSLQFVAAACAGVQLSGSPETRVHNVRTDSRQVKPGALFFALPGGRYDGHDFLREVSQNGASAVVAERARVPVGWTGCAMIAVEDTRQALGQLAAQYRKDFALPIVAVGGSNGKTTTKELVASVLKQELATLWSEASFNNDIGVPLTLLRLEKSHQAAVLEAGTNHPGELAPLIKMIRPNLGIITCIGREHLEFFGDLDGVAQEEGWLGELLPADGRLFVSGDDDWTGRMATRTRAQVIRVGFAESNDWRARAVRPDLRGVKFQVDGPKANLAGEYRINLLGRHQVVNALFAIAVGAELGLGRAAVVKGLAECRPPKMRLEFWEVNGVRLLDDTYNANADSMVAALQTMCELPCKGRRVAVLGDMAELGAHSEAAHGEVGRRAAELGIGQLFAVGKLAPVMAQAARSSGLNRVFEFADVDAAAVALKRFVKAGDLVLLKASRAMRMERIAELLRAGDAARRN